MSYHLGSRRRNAARLREMSTIDDTSKAGA
jgi:hypothetical protein